MLLYQNVNFTKCMYTTHICENCPLRVKFVQPGICMSLLYQVQCWQCANAESCLDLEDCVEQHNNNTFHCLSPLFTLGPPQVPFT